MADYKFLTTWCVDAPVEQVWGILNETESYPEWWKGVQAVELLREGDDQGVGQVSRFSWRSVLPYTLRFDMRVTRVERPHLIEGQATGELEGRGVWRLYGGNGTAVVYDWQVRTTQAWMNVLGPVARPAFAWNHDLVMRQGGLGLAEKLGASLVAHD
ncbi:MAG: SRPBCC family protein [Actinobacteria bacterium]|nr:SRPBCC family protein [Actinomycetota bacterium]